MCDSRGRLIFACVIGWVIGSRGVITVVFGGFINKLAALQ
jgi:hypothetical protein